MAAFAPLVVLTILFGVYPKPVIDVSQASVAALVENYHQALGAAKTAELDGARSGTTYSASSPSPALIQGLFRPSTSSSGPAAAEAWMLATIPGSSPGTGMTAKGDLIRQQAELAK
jgi:hypothetical protein